MRARLHRFLRERDGVAAIEFVLLLPLVLTVAIGGLYLWYLISLQNTLSAGAYRAVRYLSIEGDRLPEPWDVTAQNRARTLVLRDVGQQQLANVWLQAAGDSATEIAQYLADHVEVVLLDADGFRLNAKPKCTGSRQPSQDPDEVERFDFAIHARLQLPAFRVPWFPGIGERRMTLYARHTSYLECGQSPLYYR